MKMHEIYHTTGIVPESWENRPKWFDTIVNERTYKDLMEWGKINNPPMDIPFKWTTQKGQDLISFFKEVGELTQRERLVRGKDKVFKKLFEEIGEYAVASLGDKAVTESERQEMVDVIIIAFSLFILEGGNLDFLASYGKVKLDKWKKKLEEEGI
jgi:hypothetical protein